MSRPYEILLRESLKDVTHTYVASFARSYDHYGADENGFTEALQSYVKIIGDNDEAIYRAAAAGIGTYMNLYQIHASQSADEYKIIYYLGMAIYRHLQKNGLAVIAQIHLFTMIALLDFRLRTLGFFKPQLTRAMTNLIRGGRFESEMGETGCYLVDKCVSTSKQLSAPGTPKGI